MITRRTLVAAAGGAALGAALLAAPAHADPGQCSAQLPARNPCPASCINLVPPFCAGVNWRPYSDNDRDYLKDLGGQGIPYDDSPTAVDIGHQVCAMYTGSNSMERAENIVVAGWPGSLTKDQAFSVVIATQANDLCPIPAGAS